MVNDCTAEGEVFQLIPDGGFGSFQIRASSNGDNIDIEMLGTSEGTRAILFSPNGLKNQRFAVTPAAHRERAFTFVPAHAPITCLTEVPPQVEIFSCKTDQLTQEWELVPASCS